ncbi:MAG TPA: ribonuclease P protein component, partial [Ignavibacteriaceae bacterium]
TIISTDKKLKAILLSSGSRINKIRVAVTVSSKAGNSVWRNRFKRIIRESIRQEIEFLKDQINNNKQELSIIFSPYKLNQGNFDQIFLKDIKPAVIDILNKITKTVIKS